MSDFDDLQFGRFTGKPVRLFLFERQGTAIGRFTTAPVDLPIGDDTWTSAQIDRSEIKETPEKAKDKITVKFAYLRDPNHSAAEEPSTQSLGDHWHPYVPADEVRVTCLAWHIGASDAPKQEWTGVVVGPEFTDTELTLTCLPGPTLAQAVNQGPKWQVACWKTPYSQGPRGCGMQLDDFEIAATDIAVSGLTLTAAAFAAAPLNLAGGWFEWTRGDGLLEQRTIMAHTGDSIVLQWGATDLDDVTAGSAWPTCPQNWDGCAARFDDPENHYGGSIYKPVENPTGDSMSWG